LYLSEKRKLNLKPHYQHF